MKRRFYICLNSVPAPQFLLLAGCNCRLLDSVNHTGGTFVYEEV